MNIGKGNEKEESKREEEYYETIKAKLEKLLKANLTNFHLEITANRRFSNKLKAEIPEYRNMIFHFLKEAAPDITGFIKGEYSSDFIVVEIKAEAIKLDHIYQTRKYAELFDARYALLISLEEIPEEIKRLPQAVYSLLSLPAYKALTLVHFDEKREEFVEWFRENPFERGR